VANGPADEALLIDPHRVETTMTLKRRSPGLDLAALAILLVAVLSAAARFASAQTPPASTSTPAPQAAPIPPPQLDSLVAPIALYPDPLLAQVLAASTYPVEIVELQQWLTKNPGLKDKALSDAVGQQPWDASVQALAGFPDVVKRLSDDIQWTTNLGNAFLAQQQDVMAAVQRMRGKAKSNGTLKSSSQQVVQTKSVDNQPVIVIEQANPQVVYVPTYDPVVVYGPPVYPYPPIYYPPPPPPGALALSFGIGIAVGAAIGGSWGWGCGWGHSSTVIINNNNTYIHNTNVRTGNINTRNNTWQHDPQHRLGTPYPNQSTANRYGGTTRGTPMATRQAGAQQQLARSAGGAGGVGAGGGQDRIGSRDLSASSGRGEHTGFSGGAEGFNGSRANEMSNRGALSRGSGGFGHAGGGRRR
jgi:hypothetical protein